MNLTQKKFYLQVEDFSVSHEKFDLYHDYETDLVYTFPQPDLSELSKYYESEDYISHTDGSRTLFEKAYQLVKKVALRNKLQIINKVKEQRGALLDIGAGTGDFLATAHKNGWNTVGIEPNDKARVIAEEKGVSFAKDTFSLDQHSFDVITMWHVLEHVPDIEIQIQELKRLLKADGVILIAVPNYRSFDAKHYGVFWAAYDVPRHLWHFSKKAIKHVFEAGGLHLFKVLPMPFDAYYVSLLSEKYKTKKMNFLSAFFVGLKSNWNAKKTKEYSSNIYLFRN